MVTGTGVVWKVTPGNMTAARLVVVVVVVPGLGFGLKPAAPGPPTLCPGVVIGAGGNVASFGPSVQIKDAGVTL